MENILLVLLTLIGIGSIVFSIYQIQFIIEMYNVNVKKWKTVKWLLYFFVVCYILMIYFQVFHPFSAPLFISTLVFFANGIFAAILTSLAKSTIVNVKDTSVQKITNSHQTLTDEYDQLTYLYKRSYFMKALEKACYFSSADNPFIIIMIDIKDFRDINLKYGQGVGDNALQLLAGKLRIQFRDTDIISRYGGDQFVLLLKSNNSNDAKIYANKLMTMAKSLVVEKGTEKIPFAIAAGIVTLEKSQTNTQPILDRAFSACQQAKEKIKEGTSAYVIL